MPIYEYTCRACSHPFELLVLRSSPEAACPRCQGRELERTISTFAVSSDATRKANRKSAEKRVQAVRTEQQVERTKYEQKVLADERGD